MDSLPNGRLSPRSESAPFCAASWRNRKPHLHVRPPCLTKPLRCRLGLHRLCAVVRHNLWEKHSMLFRPNLFVLVLSALVVGATSGCRSTDPSPQAGFSSAGLPTPHPPSMQSQMTPQYANGTSFDQSQTPSSGVPMVNNYVPSIDGAQLSAANSFTSSTSVVGYPASSYSVSESAASGTTGQNNYPTSSSSSSCSSGCCSN